MKRGRGYKDENRNLGCKGDGDVGWEGEVMGKGKGRERERKWDWEGDRNGRYYSLASWRPGDGAGSWKRELG